ncbi:MAG: MATE family efflux transporter [Pseudomonadota bacterium]
MLALPIEGRTILKIALPLTTAYVAEMGMVITDMIIVGRLGSAELAAVGLAGDLFYVILLSGMGIISIVGVLAAQCLGAGDRDGVVAAGEQGMIAALLTSVPIMIVVWFFGPALFYANQDPEVVALVDAYARMLVWGTFPALGFTVLRNYITALERSAIIGWITVVAVALNLLLNYTLVYGRFGFPPLGVAGAGIGTSLVNLAMFAAMAFYLMRSSVFDGYRIRLLPLRADRAALGELLKLGGPVAMTQILNGGMFSAAAVCVGMISAATLAAQQIVYSVIYLALSAAAGFADAVRIRVAFGVGRQDPAAVANSARLGITMAAAASLVAALVLWLWPEALVRVFLTTSEGLSAERAADNTAALSTAVALSAVAGLFLFFDGTQLVIANAVRGLRDTRAPLLISLLGYWLVGLGSGLVFCFSFDWGALGLWIGLVLGVVLCNGLLLKRFRTTLDRVAATLSKRDEVLD